MKKRRKTLCDCVRRAVEQHLKELNGEDASGLHQKVLSETEKPLIEAVMKHSGGNRVKASKALGISRNTLRKKIEQFGLDA
ncbi:MAG: Fis family transcriptional regulator [Gammaproteobacteria bacterium]|nr:Fis family transcriptional regulator [Gammaproteobacteria bacterium]